MPLSVVSTTLTSSRNCFTRTVTWAETWIKVTMLAVIEKGSIVAHGARRALRLADGFLKLRRCREQEFSSSLIEAVGVTRYKHSLMQAHAERLFGPQPHTHHAGNRHDHEQHLSTE